MILIVCSSLKNGYTVWSIDPFTSHCSNRVSSSISRSWKGELEELGCGSLVREDGFTLVDELNQAYSFFFHPEWTVNPVL